MLRAFVCALVALAVFTFQATADDKPATKNQMVKGTIKEVNTDSSVLVVNQKVKNETVVRQLDIKSDTVFELTVDGAKTEVNGKEGLALLVGKEGASVQVKCDKDVNVLKVTVNIKK
jgi:hypothetical protein